MKIICIGEALIDMICTDKGRPLTEGENFLKKAGGAPTNVAAAIAALGGQVELVAKVGVDPFGQHLAQVMEDFGVGTQWVHRDASHFTTFAFVSLMNNGERDFYFNRGADGFLSVEEIEGVDLSEISIIHFGSATAFLPGPLQAAYLRLLERALDQQIFISFDPNYRHLLFDSQQEKFIAQSWNFLKQCDFFKVSDEEAVLLTKADSVMAAANQLLSETKAVFAITIGKEGTLLGLNNSLQVVPSIEVTPVDTTGAGDAFVGALLFQLQQKIQNNGYSNASADWIKMVTNANKAGARTCEYLGAMEAFKQLNQNVFN